jgi:hypothetical protein
MGLFVAFSVLAFAVLALAQSEPSNLHSVTFNASSFIVDRVPRLIRGGTIQWSRMSPELWSNRLDKFKGMGYNTVDMQVFCLHKSFFFISYSSLTKKGMLCGVITNRLKVCLIGQQKTSRHSSPFVMPKGFGFTSDQVPI